MKIGTIDITKLYAGEDEVSKIYLGTEKIYEEEQPTPPAPVTPEITLNKSSIVITGQGATDTVEVTANCDWGIRINHITGDTFGTYCTPDFSIGTSGTTPVRFRGQRTPTGDTTIYWEFIDRPNNTISVPFTVKSTAPLYDETYIEWYEQNENITGSTEVDFCTKLYLQEQINNMGFIDYSYLMFEGVIDWSTGMYNQYNIDIRWVGGSVQSEVRMMNGQNINYTTQTINGVNYRVYDFGEMIHSTRMTGNLYGLYNDLKNNNLSTAILLKQ